MLNFFVTLTNTVGIPTVLIGTSKAQQLFKGNSSWKLYGHFNV